MKSILGAIQFCIILVVAFLLSAVSASSAFATDISPVVNSVCSNGDGTYTASWGYLSHYDPGGVQQSKTITAGTSSGSELNYFIPDPKARTGQPSTFLFGQHDKVFTTTFTSSDKWIIQVRLSDGTIFYRTATASPNATLCIKPVTPSVNCVLGLTDGSKIAYWNYNNQNPAAVSIAVGDTGGNTNLFSPTPINRGQPTNFQKGIVQAAFNTAYSSGNLTWSLQYSGAGVQTASTSSTSPACQPLTPIMNCIDDNPDGSITAHFGYQNNNQFSVSIPVGVNNKFSPSPDNRGQPTTFLAGKVNNAFTAAFDPKQVPTITWNLNGATASANFNSPLCQPNTPPSCNAGSGNGNLACQGVVTTVQLDGSKSIDPEGHALTYLWTTNCANASIENATSAQATLKLTNPGTGVAQSCTASLKVFDGRNEVSCGQSVSVNPCTIDCLGHPNGEAQLDQCGVCNGTNSCFDCAGTPFGSAKVDKCGVCGGNDSCVDCKGVVNGTSKTDRCGVCDGDGTSCLGCSNEDITQTLFALDGNGLRQRGVVVDGIRDAKAYVRSAKLRKALAKIADLANQKYLKVWAISWSIPTVSTTCTNQIFCVQSDNSPTIESYKAGALELKNLAVEVTKVLKQVKPVRSALVKKILTRAQKEYQKGVDLTSGVPRFVSSCTGAS